jgi:hypothetical protein
LDVIEVGGDQYSDLAEVQARALSSLAGELARVLRDLLEAGELLVVDGKIMVNQERNP